jgi:hypothetical protein
MDETEIYIASWQFQPTEQKIKPYELLSATLDGTWSRKWRDAQTPPTHLISTEPTPPGKILCTCGNICETINEWSAHQFADDEISAATEVMEQHK